MDWNSFFVKHNRSWSDYLKTNWGLEANFAQKVAQFLIFLGYSGIPFVITSGYRSIAKQNELKRRWIAGDKSIIVKPAEQSMHSSTDVIGRPASQAIDISIKNLSPEHTRIISSWAGLHWGGDFPRTPDRVHFYD